MLFYSSIFDETFKCKKNQDGRKIYIFPIPDMSINIETNFTFLGVLNPDPGLQLWIPDSDSKLKTFSQGFGTSKKPDLDHDPTHF